MRSCSRTGRRWRERRRRAVTAVDGTAAGDAFTACLLVSLLEGREHDEALRRACAPVLWPPPASARSRRFPRPRRSTRSCARDTVSQAPARPAIMERVGGRPGHHRLRSRPRRRDRAAAGACQSGARPARRDDRARQPDAREDDRECAPGARSRRQERHSRRGRRGPAARRELTVAAHVHGESGLDGPALPPPVRDAVGPHAVDFMAGANRGERRARDARADRPADERRAAARAHRRRRTSSGSC